MIVLSEFSRTLTSVGADISCKLKIDDGERELRFNVAVDEDLAAKIQPNPVAFLMAVLVPAMERGEDIHVEGTIDGALLHKLNQYAISVLHNKYESYRQIKITCAKTVPVTAIQVPLGAMTGMSCGVDSLRTHLAYGGSDKDIPERYRLRALSVFDVGAFSDSEIEYPRILAKASEIADKSECRTIGVSANIQELYKGQHRHSCTVRHVACAYALMDLVDVYMVSSAYEWDVVTAKENPLIAIEATDAILLPMLSSARLELFSAVANESRYEKTVEIIEKSPFIGFIDTCTRPIFKRDVSKNCGSCEKCGEILLIAESLDKLDVITPNFNMEAFRNRRFRIYQRMFTNITTDRVYCPEIVSRRLGDLARSLDVPFGSVIFGVLVGKTLLFINILKGRSR